MGLLPLSFSIDSKQNLVVSVPSSQLDPVANALTVESALPPPQTLNFPGFTGSASLGAATPGVFLITATLNGTDSCASVVSISGLPDQLSVIWGIVTPAAADAFGFDIDSQVPDSTLVVLKSNYQYTFCIRYVSRAKAYKRDISSAEVGTYLAEDVALMLVRHPPKAGWSPTADAGTAWGNAATTNASTASVPAGVAIFCDLEGVASTSTVDDITAFCNNWYTAVASAGYSPGLYIGADCGLNATQLSGLSFQTFWKSCSTVPSPSQGFVMVQGPCDQNRGDATVTVNVDENTVAASPGSLMWLKRQPSA
jgi:hypothetical protein